MIQYEFEFTQSFGAASASGPIVTFIVNKMKKLEQKVEPPLAE
jgi:hypothetical protein